VALGSDSVEIDLPPGGLPLSRVLATLAEMSPHAERALLRSSHGTTLRVVRNGTMVDRDEDPQIQEGDRLMLLLAMAGG
jgi:hypothetical protein